VCNLADLAWSGQRHNTPPAPKVSARRGGCESFMTILVGLFIASLAWAPAVSAHDPHTDAGNGHTAPSPHPPGHGSPATQGVDDSTLHEGAPHASPSNSASNGRPDKCKRPKGNRPYLPWCTDPAAGWIQSTTRRAVATYPGPLKPPSRLAIQGGLRTGCPLVDRSCKRRDDRGSTVGQRRGEGLVRGGQRRTLGDLRSARRAPEHRT